MIYRQGDVMLIKTQELPAGAEPMKPEEPTRVILAHGEATGHAHALSSDLATMYQWEGDRLIEVKPGAVLAHEEHTHIPILPGIYRVVQQMEYTPQSIRAVAD